MVHNLMILRHLLVRIRLLQEMKCNFTLPHLSPTIRRIIGVCVVRIQLVQMLTVYGQQYKASRQVHQLLRQRGSRPCNHNSIPTPSLAHKQQQPMQFSLFLVPQRVRQPQARSTSLMVQRATHGVHFRLRTLLPRAVLAIISNIMTRPTKYGLWSLTVHLRETLLGLPLLR